jgi:hypothetical protein
MGLEPIPWQDFRFFPMAKLAPRPGNCGASSLSFHAERGEKGEREQLQRFLFREVSGHSFAG